MSVSATPLPTKKSGGESRPKVRKSVALERAFVEKLYQQIGRPAIQIALWDGSAVGPVGESIGRVVIHEPRVLRGLMLNPILSFGEAYSAEELTVEGDLLSTIVEINRGMQQVNPTRSWPKLPQWPWSRHSLAASKASVSHHYDIGNEFYKLWLDPQLVYTCAYYPTADTTLDDAQTAKLDYVCRKLRLKSGERVIEAGCGWGALALHMARHYGVTVRAFNLSREQLAYARQNAETQGLSGRVEFVEDDYRNISGQCDVFASVGMLEHVGPENYHGMGDLMDRCLTAQGRGLIHSIGRNAARPLDPWTVKYIFPGAYAPSLREMMDLFEDGGFSVLDVENLRLHYARTCAAWLKNFDANEQHVETMFDRKFVRMWRLYLASSSAAFVSGDLQLFQVLFARSGFNDLPMTRDDWYKK